MNFNIYKYLAAYQQSLIYWDFNKQRYGKIANLPNFTITSD